MAEIHITGINYIEINTQEGLEFKYKPDVPKLKLVGTILNAESEDEEDGVLFLTQKQLNQVLLNKDVELVEFAGQDHQISARNIRFDWWDTTMAWFDLQLKGEPEWWNTLYPDTKK